MQCLHDLQIRHEPQYNILNRVWARNLVADVLRDRHQTDDSTGLVRVKLGLKVILILSLTKAVTSDCEHNSFNNGRSNRGRCVVGRFKQPRRDDENVVLLFRGKFTWLYQKNQQNHIYKWWSDNQFDILKWNTSNLKMKR